MAAKGTEWRPGPSVCRCCFAEGCYKDISTEYFWMGKREVYSEMLTTTFDINIAYSQSGGPNSNSRLICEPCISRLRDAADFKRQVQECERVFLQHLDPVASRELEVTVQITPESPEKEVKLERVKVERKLSDDDFEPTSFPDDDDDDDDMDDEPLTKLASKVPKKESVDLMDLLDNAKAEKRKSTTKVKATPAKKVKKKEAPKPSASNAPPKTEKKKKESDQLIARRNAMLIVQYTTAYPFRIPEDSMVCVYCCQSGFEDPAEYRQHMEVEHRTFKVKHAFFHVSEALIKVDCTDMRCRHCDVRLDDPQDAAQHLRKNHNVPLKMEYGLGLQPFVIHKEKLECCICKNHFPTIRQLSRHMQSHYLKFTCESCGKSYATNTSLKCHIKYSHTGGVKICRKCKKKFNTSAELSAHVADSPKCWLYSCAICAQRFLKWRSKQEHVIKDHGAPIKTFSCSACSLEFPTGKNYYRHFKKFHKGTAPPVQI